MLMNIPQIGCRVPAGTLAVDLDQLRKARSSTPKGEYHGA